jgi:hypothetical protein
MAIITIERRPPEWRANSDKADMEKMLHHVLAVDRKGREVEAVTITTTSIASRRANSLLSVVMSFSRSPIAL